MKRLFAKLQTRLSRLFHRAHTKRHAPSRRLHQLSPLLKLLGLAVMGTVVIWLPGPVSAAVTTLLVALLIAISGLPLALFRDDLRPILMTMLIFGAVQLVFSGWLAASLTVVRMVALLMLGSLFTRTTRTTDLIAAIERGLLFAEPFGVPARRIGLVIALTLRFIPVLAEIAADVREAQIARGAGFSLKAYILPLLVRTLKMSETIAEAIDARGFDA